MAFKFLSIVKANSRIDELESQNAALTKERDEARAALDTNAAEVSKHAEELQTQLAAEKETSAALAGELNKAKDALTAKDGEIKALNDKLAAKDGEVKITVARQLAEQQAALGQPPAAAIPKDTTTTGSTVAGKPSDAGRFPNLRGLDRFIAAEKADSQNKTKN